MRVSATGSPMPCRPLPYKPHAARPFLCKPNAGNSILYKPNAVRRGAAPRMSLKLNADSVIAFAEFVRLGTLDKGTDDVR